ncbi:MAG: late competence development ComFB family protein [Candidatus Omnitrophica bacterium]|nr:late competence development ComFB family protein [Candidatus Omnitrophota bacterium]
MATQNMNDSKSKKQYHVFNYMEELVGMTLKGLISQLPKERRPSDRETVDIRALALNRLWPMYVTTERGKKFVQRDVVTDKIDRDVTRELRAAMDVVSKRPVRPTVSV